MNGSFNKAMYAAVLLLKELPRKRHAAADAAALLERFKASHPVANAELVTHVVPACGDVDYDLLMSVPDAGVLTLAWHPERGVPWTPLYSDHWAANFVLSVNGAQTTIQSALLYLNSLLKGRPNLMEDLISRALLSAAIAAAPPEISAKEIDREIDEFRISQGLYSAAATQKWLDETQMTMDAIRELVTLDAQARKFKQELTSALVHPYFDAHRQEFERITVMQVSGMSRPVAQKFAATWRREGVCPMLNQKWSGARDPSGRLETFYGSELPAAIVGAAPRAIVGPFQVGAKYRVVQILKRRPARLDRQTRAKIVDSLFEHWLKERRKDAAVQWHWV